MLVHEESSSADGSTRTVSYIYDANGVLDQSVEIIEGDQLRRIEAWYRNGVVQTKTEWIDGQPVTATRFVEDGTSVVTLFEDGRPYVDITYAPDGKRVLSLEYRKER
jgi:antitoxin component YwqK of YwqJK toxin-antitoxin module